MNKGISLYIHIPFCKQKCYYCDFPSFCGMEKHMINYAEALSREIDSLGKDIIKTIFIGGGTPTYLSLDGWNIIKESIDKLNKSQDLEFTVEGNPGTFTVEKLKLFKDMGVSRISIGLQAWQNHHLKALGRIHTKEEFIEGFKMARTEGFQNINVDLMFGLPGQSFHEWKETLHEVIKLEPEHLSCYSLIVEEGTNFYKLYEEEKLKLPDEEVERRMYDYTLKCLKEKGYYQYEISNFSLEGKECKHNLVYWNLGEYVGCGSSSHSYRDGFRYRNSESVEEYIRLMSHVSNAVVETVKNTLEDNIEEFMFMGLRKIEGISKFEFEERFGVPVYNRYGDIITSYITKGLIKDDGERICLSKKGIEVSNTIMSDFIITS